MTRLLVLGMLDIQPMSGYDIQIMLKMSDAERWGGVLIGSIYHALKKLESENLIEITSIEQTGHRQKAVYHITPLGQEHLKKLVRDSLQLSSVQYPSTMYSALSFIDKISADEAKKTLDEQYTQLENELRIVECGLNAKREFMKDSMPPMTMLIFENMFGIINQQKEFVKKALKLIEEQK